MLDILDYIYQRRSIRKYKDKKVDKETMESLIKAGMAAPTACNNQPWEFIVVTEKEVLDKLRKELTFGQYNAPTAIVVCGNMKLAKGGMENYWVQDCSAAMKKEFIGNNMILKGNIGQDLRI